MSKRVSACAAVVCLALISLAAEAAPNPSFAPAANVGTVESELIKEASGIAASRRNPGVLWVHNDSGDSARVFAISATGKHLGVYNLPGVTARDCEDIAVGPGPVTGQSYLYLGDIGDNNAVRGSIVVYRVPEPVVTPTQQPAIVDLAGVDVIKLRYEDAPRDAETLMIDPANGDLYIVSKRESRSRLYRVPKAELTIYGTAVLRRKAELPWGWATGGDISPDGDEIIVRGYANASVWSRPAGSNLWDALKGTEHRVRLASEKQGEAVSYDSTGAGYYTLSEGASQPLYYYARCCFSRASIAAMIRLPTSSIASRPFLP